MNASLNARPVTLTVRRPGLSPAENENVYFLDNNPYLSIIMAAFSIVLPEGECFFIDSIRKYQPLIDDPDLQAEVRAFIGQEAHHGNEHDHMNSLFTENGFDVEALKKRMKAKMDGWRFNCSAKQQLALTVCIEHFTALLADHAMRVNPYMIDSMSGNMKKLWAWHITEEAEHKAVCFDVYQKLVNEPWRLRLTMIWVTGHMLNFNRVNAAMLFKQAKFKRNWKQMWDAAKFFLGKKGVLTGTMSHYLAFYKPGFHPWEYDCTPELEVWRKRIA